MPSWGVFWRHIIQQRKTSNVLADVCLRGCSPLTSAAWKVKHIWAVPRPLTLLQLHYICLQLREEHLVLHGPEVMSSLCLTNHSKKSEASGDHRPITLFTSLVPRRDVPYFCPFWLSVMGSVTLRSTAPWKPLAETPWEAVNGKKTQRPHHRQEAKGSTPTEYAMPSSRIYMPGEQPPLSCFSTSIRALIRSFPSCLFLQNCCLRLLCLTHMHTNWSGLSRAPHCPLVWALLSPSLITYGYLKTLYLHNSLLLPHFTNSHVLWFHTVSTFLLHSWEPPHKSLC